MRKVWVAGGAHLPLVRLLGKVIRLLNHGELIRGILLLQGLKKERYVGVNLFHYGIFSNPDSGGCKIILR